jgi:hypothetical protein
MAFFTQRLIITKNKGSRSESPFMPFMTLSWIHYLRYHGFIIFIGDTESESYLVYKFSFNTVGSAAPQSAESL